MPQTTQSEFQGRKLEDALNQYRDVLTTLSGKSRLKLEEIDLGTYKDGGKTFPFIYFVLGENLQYGTGTDYFLSGGIHGDEPGTEILLHLLGTLSLGYLAGTQQLLTQGRAIIYPVISAGAYENGTRENLDGINVNRTIWVPENRLAELNLKKPKEISLLEESIKSQFDPESNTLFLDFHGDGRYPNTVYALANSHPDSETIARKALAHTSQKYNIPLYTGNIPESNESEPEKQVLLENNRGVFSKNPLVYEGAFGPKPEWRKLANPPVEITLETNYDDIKEARFAGTAAGLAILAEHWLKFPSSLVGNYGKLPKYVR